jgi:hypothetical protein
MFSGQIPQGADAAGSPPLHHPVPQHPIPPFRSPPPVEGPQIGGGGQRQGANPYIPQGNKWEGQPGGTTGGYNMPGPDAQSYQASTFAPYANLFTDPSAQMGIAVGLNYGQEYLGRNVSQKP